jgi:hypothetical protein
VTNAARLNPAWTFLHDMDNYHLKQCATSRRGLTPA